MPEPVRVRDKITGHKYTVRHVRENHEVLEDERAVDANGRHLPPETATTTKSSGAKKASAKTGGEPAENPEEGSK